MQVESVAEEALDRNRSDWLLSESVHEERNGKRKEWPLESVAVAPMISPIQCSFSLFFYLRVFTSATCRFLQSFY